MIAPAHLNLHLNTTRFSSMSIVPYTHSRRRSDVYFFLDFSNIAISARQLVAAHGDGILASSKLRLHAGNLRQFVERDRIWKSGFAAAGLVNQHSTIKQHFDGHGIEFEICERGQITGKEQNVDERIRMEMLELLYADESNGTIVLATGDGSGFQENRGFIKTLAILRRYGFSIEVMSWRHSLNSNLCDWASANGRVIYLDDFYEELTFIPGGRSATPSHRLFSKLARCGVI